jgi:hypothetical protein
MICPSSASWPLMAAGLRQLFQLFSFSAFRISAFPPCYLHRSAGLRHGSFLWLKPPPHPLFTGNWRNPLIFHVLPPLPPVSTRFHLYPPFHTKKYFAPFRCAPRQPLMFGSVGSPCVKKFVFRGCQVDCDADVGFDRDRRSVPSRGSTKLRLLAADHRLSFQVSGFSFSAFACTPNIHQTINPSGTPV